MLPQEIIRHKRAGQALGSEEISAFVAGIADGGVNDAQIGAWAMAVCLNGMDARETVALTEAMRDSGHCLDWSDMRGPVVDKHSTGGVGDKVSLILAPLLAACGAYVPMLSGRGLGHTGGTLDKLESLDGYQVDVAEEKLRSVVRDAGCAIVGASAELAPADKRLYGIRDVTGTVESLPLITASILSKKLAAGIPTLVLDVKAGSGAFCQTIDEANALANSLVTVARGAGCQCSALITDMNQCLGGSVGNALEVREAIAMLRGEAVDRRLKRVTLALASRLLVAAGTCPDEAAASVLLENKISGGAAAERFGRMVHALGGPIDSVECWVAPAAPIIVPVPAGRDGIVSVVDGRRLGIAVVELGGGRRHSGEVIDPAVGLDAVLGLGVGVSRGDPLAFVHARTEDAAAAAAVRAVGEAFVIGGGPVQPIDPVLGSICPQS